MQLSFIVITTVNTCNMCNNNTKIKYYRF